MKMYPDLMAVMRRGKWVSKHVQRAHQNAVLQFLATAAIVFLVLGLITGCAGEALAGDLSEHFSRKEFNQKKDGYALPLDQVIVDPELVIKLEALRSAIGDKPIRINSGYRSAWYNKHMTTGAEHSQHIHGKAADIVVEGMTAKELEPIAKKVGFTFTQTYKHLSHLHVDVRIKEKTEDASLLVSKQPKKHGDS